EGRGVVPEAKHALARLQSADRRRRRIRHEADVMKLVDGGIQRAGAGLGRENVPSPLPSPAGRGGKAAEGVGQKPGQLGFVNGCISGGGARAGGAAGGVGRGREGGGGGGGGPGGPVLGVFPGPDGGPCGGVASEA